MALPFHIELYFFSARKTRKCYNIEKRNFFEVKNMERFVIVHREDGIKIYKDTVTGVLYLFVYQAGGHSGLTPLLDSNGKPIVAWH